MLSGMNNQDSLLIKANRILKICILIGMLLLLILIRAYKLDSCDKCELLIENKQVNQETFINYYWKTCLEQYKTKLKPYDYFNNVTINFSNSQS